MPVKPHERGAVLAAFMAAVDADAAMSDCYLAGVAAWRQLHPEQVGSYAALQAVSIMLTARTRQVSRPGEQSIPSCLEIDA